MKTIGEILAEHAFFKELTRQDLEFIGGCGKNVIFQEHEVIANPGDKADWFYLIREGKVAISIETPPRKAFVFHTLGPNEILGLAWLIPPYQWTISAHAVERTHAIAFDGACLRKKCDDDPRLGYQLMKHLVVELVKREDFLRLHLLDVYAHP